MKNDIRFERVKSSVKKIYVFSLPYFFVMFMTTYVLLSLLRRFGGPGLYFLLSVASVGFGLWSNDDSLVKNLIIMLAVSLGIWLVFMGLSFILHLPLIGEASIVLISFVGAVKAFLEYNSEEWERKQIKFLM